MEQEILPSDYEAFLQHIKTRVQQAQLQDKLPDIKEIEASLQKVEEGEEL